MENNFIIGCDIVEFKKYKIPDGEVGKKKYLYLISQDLNCGYDTYDSAVVVATSEAEAKKIAPGVYFLNSNYLRNDIEHDWVISPKKVTATMIGIANDVIPCGAIICASYNAG